MDSGRSDLEGLRQPRVLLKAFELKHPESIPFVVVYFAHLIDFRSYVDATRNL